MQPAATRPAQPGPASRATGRVVALLATATFLNYFDRGSLSIAAPLIKDGLGLTNTEMGVLLSAFFWSYAPMQPIAGWLAQRHPLRYVLGAGVALWATSMTLSGLAGGFALLLVTRVMLGIGESTSYPSNARFLSQSVALERRGRANAWIAVGQSFGPACGSLLGGLLIARIGWRAAFVTFGLVTLLWIIPWRTATREIQPAERTVAPAPSYLRLLRERSLWGASIGHFCGNYAYYVSLTWIPLWLVRVHGFSLDQMSAICAGLYGMQAASAMATGSVCDRLIARGADPTRTLKGAMILGLGGVTLAMIACTVAGHGGVVAALLVAGIFFGMQSAPMGSITQTLAGPHAAAKWMGLQNLGANFAGVLAPMVTGLVVDVSGSFTGAFMAAACITILGAFAYGRVIGRVAPVRWDETVSPT